MEQFVYNLLLSIYESIPYFFLFSLKISFILQFILGLLLLVILPIFFNKNIISNKTKFFINWIYLLIPTGLLIYSILCLL